MPARQTGSIRRRGPMRRGTAPYEVRLCVRGQRHTFTVRAADRREVQAWARTKEGER